MNHVAILELHRASQVAIHERKDHILDKISTWTRNFMEQKLLDKHIPDRSKKEVSPVYKLGHSKNILCNFQFYDIPLLASQLNIRWNLL